MIYRLKAPTRKDIEEQIPFALYREDEEGTHECFATESYSYHFIGKHVIEQGTYNEEGELIEPPVLSTYVLADLAIYDDTEIEFEDPVEELEPITPMHGWQ